MEQNNRRAIHSAALDLVVCAICTEEYNDPRLLPCGHTFCLQCLEKWSQQRQNKDGRRLVCPSCKTITPLGREEKTVLQLPKDFKINQIQTAFTGVNVTLKRSLSGKVTNCEICNKSKSEYLCTSCDKTLCAGCNDKHKRNSLFKNHITKSISGNHGAVFLLCERHNGESIKYFCLSCNKALCTICAMDEMHENCNKTSLNEGLEQCKLGLKSILKPLEMCEAENMSALKDLHKIRSDIDKSFIRSKGQLQRITDEFVGQIQQWEADMMVMLETKNEQAIQMCDEYNTNVNQTQDRIKDLSKLIADIDTEANATAIIVSKSGDIMSQVKEITSKYIGYLEIVTLGFHYPSQPPNLTEFLNKECPAREQHISASEYDDVVLPPKPVTGFHYPSQLPNLTEFLNLNQECPAREQHISASEYDDIVLPPKPVTCNLLWSITRRSSQTGEILSPVSVSFTQDENLLVSEMDSCRVQVFDKIGNSIATLLNISPKDAVTDQQGVMYVADAKSCEVLMYNHFCKPISSWGKGLLYSPRSLAIAKNGCIIVVDKESCKITIHTKDGEMIQSSDERNTKLCCPTSVCTDSMGRIIVADRELNQVLIYNNLCQFQSLLEPHFTNITIGTHLLAVCVDDEDNIFMCMHEEQCVFKYNSNGKFIKVVLSTDDGIAWPTGIAVGPNGYLAVVESKVTQKHSALKLFKLN